MSVCIVHRDGWAVSDSRWSVADKIIPDVTPKVIRTPNLLLAIVGDGKLVQDTQRLADTRGHEGDFLQILSDSLGEKTKEMDGYVLAVDLKGKITWMFGDGCLCELDEGTTYWSIGSSADYVHGFLDALSQDGCVNIEIKHAQMAIERAAKFDSGIDDRTQVFLLRG